MINYSDIQCFYNKRNIWHTACSHHFSYQYLNMCFLHWTEILQVQSRQRCNLKQLIIGKRPQWWTPASCLDTLIAFDLKAWGWWERVLLRMTTGTWRRYLIAETGEWSCQGVTYELMTFGLGNALEWGCRKVKHHSNSFELLFKRQEKCVTKHLTRVPSYMPHPDMKKLD